MPTRLPPPMAADAPHDPSACEAISTMLSRLGDKWSILVVSTLGCDTVRFNELRRRIGDISQKMLSSTLKGLERDGLVSRTVVPTVPPQVDYRLTDLGREFLGPVSAFAEWTSANRVRIAESQRDYDRRRSD